MLSKLSALLHQAAEFSSQILTTDESSAQDEFKSHWKEVTDAITDREHAPTGSLSMITGHLDAMLDLLCLEEEKMNPSDPGTVGPCLELVLRNKVLDTLYTAGRNDYPSGMAHHVLNFFTMLLSRLERQILHHVSIHQPILLQIDSCGASSSSSLAIHQVQFLRTLCVRLMKDPRLADFFIKDENDKVNFVLLSALLRLANSSDHLVVMKSYESILTCASLRHSSVTSALATSPLPVMLASKLQFHFQLIFPNTKHTDILSCNASWGSSASLCSGHASNLGHTEALYSWLDLCEQIIALSQRSIGKVLCDNIREVFLKASLLPKLLKTKEEEILISTSVLMHAIQVVSNEELLKEFVHFILRDSLWVLADESSDVVCRDNMVLIEKLICRIDHINEDVCSTTLQLFDVLLRLPFPMIIEELTQSSSAVLNHILQPDQMHSARVQLEQDTVSYLSLIPSCLSTGGGGVEDLSQYLREAHDKIAKSHELGRRTSSSSCSVNGDKSFLGMLLNKLESMLNQPYEINLLVTSLFAQLAAVPHPAVESLFQTGTYERNVYTILKKVAEAFQMRVERTPGLIVHIVEARRRLEGLPTSDLLSMPHNDLLEGSVVLEEFIKELCAIIYAKKSWNILALPAF